MSGAVADHYRVTVLDRLKPEKIPADDVARLPNQEMVCRYGPEFLTGRQDGGLDAARITQALENELIGGGGPLLALLDLGQIAIDGDGTASRNRLFLPPLSRKTPCRRTG